MFHLVIEEEKEELPSFGKIFKFYLHFLKPKYKLCRIAIYFLVINQGIKFFTIGFQPEAIYRGFDKSLIPNIEIICEFISMAMNAFMSKFIT